MSVEKQIHEHLPYLEAGEHAHVSMASHRRRQQEIENMVWEWRTDAVEHQDRKRGEVIGDQFIPFDFEEREADRQELRGVCE